MEEQSDTPRTDATQYQWTRTLDLARDLERELATATRERDEARADLETERLRLAACGVVAMANTPESAARVRDILPVHFSASLHSVMGAVDREMELRAEVERLRAAIEQHVAEAVEREREECALICDAEGREWDSDAVVTLKNYAEHCAAAIRARAEKEKETK